MLNRHPCAVTAIAVGAAVGALVLIIILTPILWFGGFMLHLAMTTKYECYPPEYPSLATPKLSLATPITSFTSDPIEQVRDRYVSHLHAKPRDSADLTGLWWVAPIAQDYFLECNNTPNDSEVECAGILLSPVDAGTKIERVRAVSEGGGCSGYLDMPQVGGAQ